MNITYIVYADYTEEGDTDRRYAMTCDNIHNAHAAALYLSCAHGIYHGVCRKSEAKNLLVKGVPTKK